MQIPHYRSVIKSYEERQSSLLGYLEEQIETAAEEGQLIFEVEIDMIFEGSELNQLKMYFEYIGIDVIGTAFIDRKHDTDNPIHTILKFQFRLQ